MAKKNLHVVFVLDPLEKLKFDRDTSVHMMTNMQSRGWSLYYARTKDLFVEDGKAMVIVNSIALRDKAYPSWTLGPDEVMSLAEFDVLLMRKDPPFTMEYIYATYVLERAKEEGLWVINDPSALRSINEKFSVSLFPDLAPPTVFTKNAKVMEMFIDRHKKVVAKPLDMMGGHSIFVIEKDSPNRNVIIESLSHDYRRTICLQKYLPQIKRGDHRMLFVDGRELPYVIARMPQGKDHRGNLSSGAKAVIKPLSKTHKSIAKKMRPLIRKLGVFFVGIDLIGSKVTEFNLTSPLGLREITHGSDFDATSYFVDQIEKKFD
ncbi:MAG: glutathione synthase [Bdellovibrionales bacterium]|nr:glutathione synthase [Bdellovibrionales bacterium]